MRWAPAPGVLGEAEELTPTAGIFLAHLGSLTLVSSKHNLGSGPVPPRVALTPVPPWGHLVLC